MSVLLLCCQGGVSSVFVTSVLLLCCQGGLSSVFVTCQCCYCVSSDFTACQCCYCVVRVVSAVFLSHVSAVIVLSGWCQQCFCHMSVLLLCCQGGLSSVFVTCQCCYCVSSAFSYVSAVIVSVEFLSHVSGVTVFIIM